MLADGYRRALTHFSEDEIRALFVSGASPLADLGLERGLRAGRSKSSTAAWPTWRSARRRSRVREFISMQRRWNQAEPPRALLTTLRRAVWDDRRVRIRYEDRNRTTLDAYRRSARARLEGRRLVSRRALRRGAAKFSRRTDRARADELAEHFERPADFDLERYWSESSARFAEASRGADCVVTLRVRNDALDRVTALLAGEIVARRARDSLVRVTFPGHEVALFQLIAWADAATLVEPVELRDRDRAAGSARLATLP